MDSTGIERVFLRLVNCDTDERLGDLLNKFLVLVLTALEDKTLVAKVNELLGHVNKRLLHRSEIQLPFYALVELITRTDITPFTMNMGVLYTKKAFERMPLNERVANIDVVFSCLASKTEFQCNVLLAVLLPTLPHLTIPRYEAKQRAMLPSLEETNISRSIFTFAIKVMLLSYESVVSTVTWKVEPSLSEEAISSILKHTSLTPGELEQSKCTILNIICCDIFNYSGPLVAALLVAASADTRCSVTDVAESMLKRLRNVVDWEKDSVVVLLYGLFLGADKLPPKIRSMSHGGPVGSLRLKLKLLPILINSTRAADYFPLNIQVVFGGLFGEDSNKQLNLSAALFIHKICDGGSDEVLKTVGPMLKQGLLKIVQTASNKDYKLCGKVYMALGKLSTRCPSLFSSDVHLLSLLFTMLDEENKELLNDLREGLFLMTSSYKLVLGTEDEQLLEDLLLKYINKADSSACVVALRFSNILHPTSHLPSRYLCLLSLGSSSVEVVEEAKAGLDGTDRLPEFSATVKYIAGCTKDRLTTPSLCYVMGTQILAYLPTVYIEVLKFVRKCLEVKIPDTVIEEDSKYQHLRALLVDLPAETISAYKELIMSALVSAASGDLQSVAMGDLLQVSVALPETLSLSFNWCKQYLKAPSARLRHNTAALLGIAARKGADVGTWGKQLLDQLNNKKSSFEEYHGAILAVGHVAVTCPCKEALIKKTLEFIVSDNLEAVCTTIYHLGCSLSLAEVIGQEATLTLHQHLITLISQNKEQKILVFLTPALGALHVHENELRLDQTINVLLNTSKLALLELNFSIGKTLALMSSGPNTKVTVPAIYVNIVETVSERETSVTKTILEKIVRDFVLSDVRECQYQATSIWLLSLLKYSTDVISIRSYKSDIQHSLSMLLSNKDVVTQEVASEALALLYSTADPSQKSQLIDMLKFSLLNETVPHKHVGMETKIFSTEDLGKLPSSMGGGNLTTYKELCSLASDMNQPEMIYQFMHLSNHSSIWSDRVGAAFGVGTLIKTAGKELEPYLARIIPRIYRYQYDPNLKVQQSMTNIWKGIVPKPKETVDRYIKEILSDLKENIHHRLWRTRESCCSALADLVRTRAYNDHVLDNIPELWVLVLKLMDDIKESTRLCAAKTADTLSKITISVCNVEHGVRGARAISAILPVLLENGITSSLVEIQTVAIVTVMKMSENSGTLLNPHTHIIIPAFIGASATIEPKAFGHVTMMVSGSEEDREKLEESRAQFAVASPLVKVIDKCLRYIDEGQLGILVSKLSSLAKSSVGLTPRVTLLHTVSLLAVNTQHTLTPYVGKLMAALFTILSDRSVVVRAKCAGTVAVLIRYGKPSTVDNVLEKLQTWYMEKDEDTQYLVSLVMFNISSTAPETLQTVYGAAVPLILYGRHTPQEEQKEKWDMIWVEMGVSDHSSILLYIPEISALCLSALNSTSWSHRKQAAMTLETVAEVLADSYPAEQLIANTSAIIKATEGRYWPGKEAVLAAFAATITPPKKSSGAWMLPDIGLTNEEVVDVFLRECRKPKSEYVAEVMRYFGLFIGRSAAPPDCWAPVWDICHGHLTPPPAQENTEMETESKKKTETFTVHTKLQEASILLVGVAWQCCTEKPRDIVRITRVLGGLVRLCTWKIQPVLLCSIQTVITSLNNTWADRDLHVATAETVLGEVLRCVDDMRHVSVRGLALTLVSAILAKLEPYKNDVPGGILKRGVREDILKHLRDQTSLESNQNLKAKGTEIVSLIERDFV